MISHSFRVAVFGPVQALHGATFVVDAAFIAEKLDANGIVVDIGRALDELKATLAPLNYRNLDDLPELKGANTTTEYLTKHIFERLAEAARAGKLGRDGRELKAIRVTLSEPHIARAWYEAALWQGSLPQGRLVPVARDVRLRKRDTDRLEFAVPGDLATP